jgi:hypothetical protein
VIHSPLPYVSYSLPQAPFLPCASSLQLLVYEALVTPQGDRSTTPAHTKVSRRSSGQKGYDSRPVPDLVSVRFRQVVVPIRIHSPFYARHREPLANF